MSGAKRTRSRRGSVTITEQSNIPRIRRQLEELAREEVRIGMHGNAELALVAAVLEFGSAANNIPSRPFVRIGKRRAQAPIGKLVRASLQEIAEGRMSPDRLRRDIGQLGLAKMEQAFDKMRKPALLPAYAEQKGSKKLLIDERELRESLTYIIARRR